MDSNIRACAGMLLAAFLLPPPVEAAGESAQADEIAEVSTAAKPGRMLYIDKGCYSCHGYEGQGALLTGPRIAPDPLPLGAFIAAIRRPRDEMPAYSPAVLSDQEIRQMHEYLKSLPPPAAPTPGFFPEIQ